LTSVLLWLQKFEHNVETNNVEDEDLDKRQSKAKYTASNVLEDPLPSPTISTSSLVSECPNSNSESESHINNVTYDYLPQGKIFTYYFHLCYFWIFVQHIFIYFIFSDYTLTEEDDCAHCIILDSKEDEILVRIDDISIKKRYLTCLLDKDRWLDDEVSTLTNNTIVLIINTH
jgi:hypothetical protein